MRIKLNGQFRDDAVRAEFPPSEQVNDRGIGFIEVEAKGPDGETITIDDRIVYNVEWGYLEIKRGTE